MGAHYVPGFALRHRTSGIQLSHQGYRRAPGTTPILQMTRPRLKEVSFTMPSNQEGDGTKVGGQPVLFLLLRVGQRMREGLMEETRCEELEGCSLSPSVTSQSGGW